MGLSIMELVVKQQISIELAKHIDVPHRVDQIHLIDPMLNLELKRVEDIKDIKDQAKLAMLVANGFIGSGKTKPWLSPPKPA